MQQIGVFISLLLLTLSTLADSLPTVASTNLCADLLLLQIADPAQIISVSRASHNPQLSPLATAAARYPPNRGSVEEMLALKPNIVLVYSGWMGRRHAQLLANQGIEVIALPYPKHWDDALNTARQLAARLGRSAAEAKIVALAQQMAALAATARPAYNVLYLRANGGTAGANTYVDDVLQRLHLRNAAVSQGVAGWGRMPLEQVVLTPPEVFLLGYFEQNQAVNHATFAQHPLLQRMLAQRPTVSIAGKAWGCGGLETLDAAAQLAAQLARLPSSQSLSPQR
ncbi:ABC transporter substrate-binding protein [Chromatium okenii]|uniref:ABC transporter substrate-binding protein n=1 Tax=Chromatium okenii TaxID=61644 RepID=UPI0019054BAF|nr:ABC transporter substrate-binding protein [Chromatium okenii]MBK1640902.1 ABC transporter substrate-binding protein [Chromatium okenii]